MVGSADDHDVCVYRCRGALDDCRRVAAFDENTALSAGAAKELAHFHGDVFCARWRGRWVLDGRPVRADDDQAAAGALGEPGGVDQGMAAGVAEVIAGKDDRGSDRAAVDQRLRRADDSVSRVPFGTSAAPSHPSIVAPLIVKNNGDC